MNKKDLENFFNRDKFEIELNCGAVVTYKNFPYEGRHYGEGFDAEKLVPLRNKPCLIFSLQGIYGGVISKVSHMGIELIQNKQSKIALDWNNIIKIRVWQ